MMVSFCAVFFFPRGVLDEILNLIESVSEGFPSYSSESSFLLQYCFFLLLHTISSPLIKEVENYSVDP